MSKSKYTVKVHGAQEPRGRHRAEVVRHENTLKEARMRATLLTRTHKLPATIYRVTPVERHVMQEPPVTVTKL